MHKTGYCIGVWDQLHEGHKNFLRLADSMCEQLYVYIINDDAVRRAKGEGRPIQTLRVRWNAVCDLGGTFFCVPINPEKFLTLMYGPNWRIPDKNKKYNPLRAK